MGEQILLISCSQTSYSEQPLFMADRKRGATKDFSYLWALGVLCSAYGDVLDFFEAVSAGFIVYEEEPSTLWKSVSDSFSLPFVPSV